MRKSVEQLINVGYDIKLALEVSNFRVYLYEEDAYLEFRVTKALSKNLLNMIPNDFRIFPDEEEFLKLIIYEMPMDNN